MISQGIVGRGHRWGRSWSRTRGGRRGRDVSRVGSAGDGGISERGVWRSERVRADADLLMAKDANGYWSGFMREAGEGDTYGFYVVGAGSRDISAIRMRESWRNDPALPFPVCLAVIRSATGVSVARCGISRAGVRGHGGVSIAHWDVCSGGAGRWASTFLDVVEKMEYLVALGINVVQPLPVYEMEDSPSQGYPGLGYQGSDMFSPAIDYAVYDADSLTGIPGDDQPAAGGEGASGR